MWGDGMRIEAQGHVEAQPPFAHVGYAAAHMPRELLGGRLTGPSLPALGVGLMLLALGIRAVRRARRTVGAVDPPAAGICILATCVLVGALLPIHRIRTLTPPSHETLCHIEEASALTEQWQAELGRVPTQSEWRERMAGRPCALDAWGKPLGYEAYGEPCPMDNQRFVIWREGSKREGEGIQDIFRAIDSTNMGPDGLFGTKDDEGMLHLWGDWQEPGRYAHGREPRQQGGTG